MCVDGFDKIKQLSAQMDLEPAEETGCIHPRRHEGDIALTDVVMPGGKSIRLLKTLLTSACERNCFYCPFRAGRDFRRATFKPEELAQTFMALHRAGLAQGIFLSSGIVGKGIRTQDQLIASAEILRYKLGYQGYLHLKIMPGAERAQVERCMQLADRVSINLEAPNALRLEKLAPRKQFFDELVKPLQWVEEIRKTQPEHLGWNRHWPSSVTQFVVGGAGENDLELLSISEQLFRRLRLRRTYYSAFKPFPDTPLENLPPESPVREHRLYQASFLLRDYGFSMEELPLDEQGNLPLANDPKLVWAQQNLAESPVEINRASRHELIRVPGVGPVSASRIIEARRLGRVDHIAQLGKLGVNTDRIAPFILLNGKRPAYQRSFW